jgi:uncharacterized protein YndB with AHSA1/START domain
MAQSTAQRQSEAVAQLARPSLTLKRRLEAPPAKVFAAWTDPAKIARWFRPSHTIRAYAETDPRVGGRYRIVVHSAAGEEHEVSGTYLEVVPHEKLVFTWSGGCSPQQETLVTVSIKPDGAGSLLTLIHEQFFDEEARYRHEQGWTGCLDALEPFLA